ncbi:ankyrin repeat protein (macronuclear) [Tetrahymena thermophila SB210]|uniref:Ankyrin repeat protein n=1 Tax=Tetrahymena thermophila (strain SB210) TaxID=312017 RepID=I7M489_TETTS|nr:ankyrin repeat protein [Tetrahymena thermophila SB210]EAS05959.2 ankyrin repeat protein [Tetrahymena thermophila SB210]|eukprot:XP_001026204.2 ankyrin repeat protein [Tetrahymena thermophila SB210]
MFDNKTHKRVGTIVNNVNNYYLEQEEKERLLQASMSNKKPQKKIIQKQVYMQHLEKRLNEITAIGKEMRDIQANQTQSKQKEMVKQLQMETQIKDSKQQQKKLRLCKQFMQTGLCRNKDTCKYAHSIQTLDTEYFPQSWVNHFKRNMILNRPQSAVNLKSVSQITSPPKAVDNIFNFFYPSLSNEKKVTISPQTQIFTINQNKQNQQEQQLQQTPQVKNPSNSERIKQFLTRVQSAKIQKQNPKPIQDPNIDKVINQKGRTMLMEAVIQGNIEAVRNFLQLGANPNLTDWKGDNSIIHAIKKNFNDILGVILDTSQKYINLNNRFFTNKVTYLMMAAKLSQSDMVKTLLAAKADPNITDEANRTAIFYCIFNNDLESIYDLVEGGTNLTIVDDRKKTCVDYAFQRNQIDLINYLFSKGGALADTTQHHKIMFLAVQNNKLGLVYELIKRGNSPMSVDENGNNLMLLAIKHQYYDSAIELCQDYSLNNIITQNNKQGENCIFLSIKEQAYQLAKFFIRQAKSLDCVDNEGKTALIYAAESNQDDLVELVMQKDIQDINKQDKKMGTALIYAAKTENILSIEHILKCKQTVKAYLVDFYGKKARHYCQNKTAAKRIINRYMIDQGQLSESLIKGLLNFLLLQFLFIILNLRDIIKLIIIKEMEEEEDYLNKQMLFKIKTIPQHDSHDQKFKKVKQNQQQYQS